MESQGPQIAKTILKKKYKAGEPTLLILKLILMLLCSKQCGTDLKRDIQTNEIK